MSLLQLDKIAVAKYLAQGLSLSESLLPFLEFITKVPF